MKSFGLIYHVDGDKCLIHIVGANSVTDINNKINKAMETKNVAIVKSQSGYELVKLLGI